MSIWDEAHKLKNDKSKNFKAAAMIGCADQQRGARPRFGLTGTPMANKCVPPSTPGLAPPDALALPPPDALALTA